MPPKQDQEILFPGLWENSRSRYQNAEKLAKQIPHSAEGLQGFLGDHAALGAVCQHGKVGQADLHTSVAMILAPKRRAMIASEGYGCGTYQEWRI
jgi:hypothetical protein